MPPDFNPFAALSLIVAPAILTNASTVLIMSTSNRLARAVDRARDLSRQIEADADPAKPETRRRLGELGAAEDRALLLLRALRRYYTALSGFALATLLSLFGAVSAPLGWSEVLPFLELFAIAAGVVAVGALVDGSITLVRETRIAVQVLRERAATIRERLRGAGA